MTAAFLDTSGWFAALSPKEAKHRAAHAAYREWLEQGIELVTTNLVVAEMQMLVSLDEHFELVGFERVP